MRTSVFVSDYDGQEIEDGRGYAVVYMGDDPTRPTKHFRSIPELVAYIFKGSPNSDKFSEQLVEEFGLVITDEKGLQDFLVRYTLPKEGFDEARQKVKEAHALAGDAVDLRRYANSDSYPESYPELP